MWKKYNPNPEGERVGDCTVRAISKALDQSWEKTYFDLCATGFMLSDMPNANHVWGAYLRTRGFTRYVLPNKCPDCYTVKDFCIEHPKGTYILALNGHVVCVRNGNYFDSWNSGNEVPIYYWKEEE